MEGVIVKCPCGRKLGECSDGDDHGSVDMRCPDCRDIVIISNQAIAHPDLYGGVQSEDGMTIVGVVRGAR